MKTIQSLWTDFEIKYSNHPVPFEDGLFGDGISTTYQISFYPIYDLANLLPVITINTGTIVTPIWTILTEWTEYTINYQNGEIIFQSGHIPKELLDTNGERVITAKINAHHCKINLKQFLGFFNFSRQHLTQWFPVRNYLEVQYTDLGFAQDDELLEIDMSHTFFDNIYSLEQIMQEKDSKKHNTFYRRWQWLFLDSPNSEWPTYYPVGPTDYWRGPTPNRQALKFPFWIYGIIMYPEFDLTLDPNTYLATETYLINAAIENCIMRIALLMYQYRLHLSERMNASTLRISTMKEVQGMVMGLSMDLQAHLAQYAPGSGTIAPTYINN